MQLEVTIDPDLCIGSGDCVRVVPGAFLIDDAAGVSVPTADAPGAGRDAVLRAALGCPTQAIRVAEGGVVLHESNG
jgi:ferredoxin